MNNQNIAFSEITDNYNNEQQISNNRYENQMKTKNHLSNINVSSTSPNNPVRRNFTQINNNFNYQLSQVEDPSAAASASNSANSNGFF